MTTIILLLISLVFLTIVIIKIIKRERHHPDVHKIHREPLFYKDGEFLNTHQYKPTKEQKRICVCGDMRDCEHCDCSK